MTIDYITRKVKRIKKKYDETDPYRLCNAMGILLLFHPMGISEYSCKGFLLVKGQEMSIVINSDLSENLQRIIIAHELGHAVLHRNIAAVKEFNDLNLFDESSRWEYEANIFAAEFLVNDSDVLELLTENLSFFDAASMLGVPAELLDFKFRIIKRKGYKVIAPPLMASGDFLKNVNNF